MGYGQFDGETSVRTRNTDIAALKAQAMEELSAIGVTFPIHCNWPILAGAANQQDTAVVLRQCFSDSLGDDFVVLDIIEYVSSVMQEIVNAHKHSIIGNGWGADFGDPINFLSQEILHDDNAYYAMNYGFIGKMVKEGSAADWQSDLVAQFEEFTKLVNDANAIVDDIDARYDAFAEAEAYMLQHALTCPEHYDVSWCLTHANEYSKINAMYGIFNYKYVDWETSEEAPRSSMRSLPLLLRRRSRPDAEIQCQTAAAVVYHRHDRRYRRLPADADAANGLLLH